MKRTWVLILTIALLLTAANSSFSSSPKIEKPRFAKAPVLFEHYKTPLGFKVTAPMWLPFFVPEVRKETSRIIDEMWVRFDKKFDTKKMDPKKIHIQIHDRMGTFRWPELAPELNGISWVKKGIVIVAWDVSPISGDVSYLTTISSLYHEWAHFTGKDSDWDHKDGRWKIVADLEKNHAVAWEADFLPKPPLFFEIIIRRPAGHRSELPPKSSPPLLPAKKKPSSGTRPR